MQNFEPGCAGSPDSYRTGSTNPPKNYRGLIAALLILVILLMSVVTVLSMMNIRLSRLLRLEQQADSSVQFSENGIAEAAYMEVSPEAVHIPELGLTGEEIASVYRRYNQWPQGLYISQVEPDGPADRSDIRPGDILIAVNGQPIAGKADFQVKVEEMKPGNPMHLTVFREDTEFTIPLTPIAP